MELTAREAATLLNVTLDRLHQWIKTRGLPAHRVNEQYRFNQSQLLEWATAEGLSMSARAVAGKGGAGPPLLLARALELGGVIHDLPGQQIRAVLNGLVARLSLPTEIDRTFLLQMLVAREQLGSTGIGEGIAIPHVRNPIVLRVSTPMVTLAYLRHPAIDRKKCPDACRRCARLRTRCASSLAAP